MRAPTKSTVIAAFIFASSLFKSQVSFTLPSPVCPNVAYTVTAQTGTTSVNDYTWSSNPSGVAISHTALPTTLMIFPTGTAVYTISLVYSTSSGTAIATQSVAVTSSLQLQVSFSDLYVCPGSTASITATGASQYTWMPGNGNSPQIVVPAGSYTVTATTGGCTGSLVATLTEVTCTDIKEQASAIVGLYPNPARDEIAISRYGAGATNIDIRDITGRMLIHEQLIDSETTIDISSIPEGIYFVHFSGSKGVNVSARFVKLAD